MLDCSLQKVQLGDGQTLGHGTNPWQAWLWSEWLKMQEWVETVAGGDAFSLLLNGDCIEGIHHRSDEVMAAGALLAYSRRLGKIGET